MTEEYNHTKIEAAAQKFWEEHYCFQTTEDVSKEKFYSLCMFPYPSGHLHMGHVRNYTIGDVVARYQRMLGKNVLQPMGWDAFGLPAENAAIQHKIPPAEWTYQNIIYMRKQLKSLGLAIDWSREITTCDPSYYRWEQWFFIKLFEKGLVYKKNAEVNWDPVDQTILANEQVIDGRGWRSGALVERREIPQWFLKITAYAEQLLNDLDQLNGWPEQVKTMQRNWIGKSTGIEIDFPVDDQTLTIFTTRADTLFGVTYIAIAPQHSLAKAAAEKKPAVKKFLEECRTIKVAEAELATLEKRGVNTGLFATHPLTQEKLPIWVANFVVMDYAAGALMAVPAHDQRDFEFAKQYDLPIRPVVKPTNNSAWDYSKGPFTAGGIIINSQQFNELDSKTATDTISQILVQNRQGKIKINYRLRDWSISRQRYWGAPIPMINCSKCGTVPAKNLPVLLPEKVSFAGVTSPLKSLPEFLNTTCPQCGNAAERETDTFDTFFESSWYYARYACKKLETAMLDTRANYWTPVDQYVGGVEHAVMHLLYARFMHKLLRDEGLVNSSEPFLRLLTQGMVLKNGMKMSKSKGNTVDPKPLLEKYGADTVRLFMIFASPPEQTLEWSDSGVEGAYRFLKRLWAFCTEHRELIKKMNHAIKGDNKAKTIDWDNADEEQRTTLRQIYENVDQAKYDYERLQFNTVVSSCMKLLNLLSKIPASKNPQQDKTAHILHHGICILLRLLAPITPHITHQLWQDLSYSGLIIDAALPKTNSASLKAAELELVVQINGKLKTKVTVPSSADAKTIEDIVKQDAKVQRTIADQAVKKIILVPGKLVNIVTEK